MHGHGERRVFAHAPGSDDQQGKFQGDDALAGGLNGLVFQLRGNSTSKLWDDDVNFRHNCSLGLKRRLSQLAGRIARSLAGTPGSAHGTVRAPSSSLRWPSPA